MPVFAGLINPDKPTFEYKSGRCFKKILFTYEETLNAAGDEIDEIRITVVPSEPVSALCYEWLVIVTNQFVEFETFFLARP